MSFENGDYEQDKSFEEVYRQNLGKPGIYTVGKESFTGVLTSFNLRQGYMTIQPSIVSIKGVIRIETETPRVVGIPAGIPMDSIPLQEGDLEEIVKAVKGTEETTDDHTKEGIRCRDREE